MTGKRIAALLLAMGMVVTAVAGCGNAEGDAGKADNSSVSADTTANDSQDADASDDTDDVDEDELTEITVALMCLSPKDTVITDPIVEKINAITESEIGVHVNFEWFDGGSYGTQVTMKIQGGDPMDLMMFTPIPGASYSSFLSAGQIMDIADLLDEYGQDIKNTQGELINACSLNGGIYGVGNYRDVAAYQKMVIREDVLKEVGRLEDAEKATSWSEVEDIMKDVVAAGYPGVINNDAQGTVLYPNSFMNGSDDFSENYSTDILGDGYLLVSTDESTDTVQCKYFTDEFKQMIERVSRWYEEGLINKDAAKEPEAAIKFLNLLYTSEDIMNTLTWGIEGRDWVMGDDGYATYPDGVTSETVSYHEGDFLYGNQFITAQWEGATVTREEQREATESAKHSKYYGFQIDNTGLENTVTACYNVEQQYIANLMSGAAGANWEQTLQDFQDGLKKAGIDELITAYQEQLDAWLAQQ